MTNEHDGALTPFFVDRNGVASPLFVPPSMLAQVRQANPKLWIEPTPMLDTQPTPDQPVEERT